MRVRRHGLGVLVALFVAAALSCANFDNDELQCEEAVSRLEECCPDIDARRFSCDVGCNSGVDFTNRAAGCVRDRSCDDLRNRDICAAMTRIANEPYPGQSTAQIEQEVCR
ncbi:MAG: hypothetical protein KIT84_08400 [Labilithrix sp.]|nr:hypothetical protein [Labilithrix sp.]MCW5811018.1 hypothetical protein [Labilithrix sp.]